MESQAPEVQSPAPTIWDDLAELKKAAKEAKAYSTDVETTSLNIRQARLISMSFAVGTRSWLIPFAPLPNAVTVIEARDWLNENLFNDPEILCIGHNLKYDWHIYKNHGCIIKNKTACTMVAEWMCNETGAAPLTADHSILGLKELMDFYFNEKRSTYEEVEPYLFLEPKRFMDYSRQDSLDAWRLWFDRIVPAMKKEGPKIEKLFWELEMPLIPILMEMEDSGMFLDFDMMASLIKENEKQTAVLYEKICKIAGEPFNIKSGVQLSDILFGKLKISPKDIQTVAKSKPEHMIYSVDKKSLKKLRKSHEIIPLVEDYLKLRTMHDGFLTKLLRMAKEEPDHRIYPTFKQTGTKIGRLSSENPNGQNMPRKGGIRDSVCAPEGKTLVVGDLNQIELRILAHLSEDPTFLKTYRENGDVHQATMDAVGCERPVAKASNFGMVYGMSPSALAALTDISIKRAQEVYNKWFEKFSGVRKLKEKTRWDVIKDQLTKTIFGRRRRFYGVPLDDYAHRQAFHFTVSGSAADVIKIGMVKLYKALLDRREKLPIWHDVKMLAQIHDELVLETPEGIAQDVRALVQSCMEDVAGGRLKVPVKAKVAIGKTWGSAKD